MNDQKMTYDELKITWSLGTILSLRMFGMFMILPVLTTYGMTLAGANKLLIGLSIGIYGLTQATLQIPLGLLSDRIGRKPVIIGGLIVFIIGSVIAALTNSIFGVIIGRALQGSGAISSSIMALLSDLIREQNRTKAITFVGIIFSLSFIISITIGPILTRLFGLHVLFWIISFLSIICIFLISCIVPDYKIINNNCKEKMKKVGFNKVLRKPNLLKLNFSIMCLHTLLMFIFTILPRKMISAGFSTSEHWKVYITTVSVSFIFVIPLIIYTEKKCCMKRILFSSTFLLLCSEIMLWISGNSLIKLLIGIQLFFLAFSSIEGLLPSFVSKESPTNGKGVAMGIYSTSQFIGVAFGGTFGGWLDNFFSLQGVFFIGVLITIVWLLVVKKTKEPPYIMEVQFEIPNNEQIKEAMKKCLAAKIGVSEVLLIPGKHIACVKINRKIIDQTEIEKIIRGLTEIYIST